MADHRLDRRFRPASVSPVKHSMSGRSLISPADSDQEQNDLEVAAVLAKEPHPGMKYASPSKSQGAAATCKSVLSPMRPSTVMTNLQRGNVQTTTPSLTSHKSIHQMAAQGELILLRQEIEGGADVNRSDDSGFTALLWACACGQIMTMEYLLEKGANIQHSGNHGENSLLLASCHGYTDIVSQLVSLGMSVNYTDESGSTALMYAAYNNHTGCVRVLLEYGADITIENEEGLSAMDLAVGQSHKGVQQVIETHMLSLFGGLP